MAERRWRRIERGGYASDLGRISLDGHGRWFFWPSDDNPIGPFNSLVRAKNEAERKQADEMEKRDDRSGK